jgi:hypothetical protein
MAKRENNIKITGELFDVPSIKRNVFPNTKYNFIQVE